MKNFKIPLFSVALVLCILVTLIPYPVKATQYYGDYYGLYLKVEFLEGIEQKYSIDAKSYITYYLNVLSSRYAIAPKFLLFHMSIYPDTTVNDVKSIIDKYVAYFNTYYGYDLYFNIASIRTTHSLWNSTFMHSLYGGIASKLNSLSKVKAFIGESELEGNTTCPICGLPGAQQTAFQNNINNMIQYAQTLYNCWHQYSSIPFTHASVCPWTVTSDTVSGGMWFSSMGKTTYVNYISQTQDILCFTVWKETDGVDLFKSIADSTGKQILVGEYNWLPIPQNIVNIVETIKTHIKGVAWFLFGDWDEIVGQDWACPEHPEYRKYDWYAFVKTLSDPIPEGNYIGVMTQWMDRINKYRHYLGEYGIDKYDCEYLAEFTNYAFKNLGIVDYSAEAFEFNVLFDAYSIEDNAEIVLLQLATGFGYPTIGLRVYKDNTVKIFMRWVKNDLSYFEWQSSPFAPDYNWWKLRLYHDGSTIYVVINDQVRYTAYNGLTGRTFMIDSVKTGDFSTKCGATIYLDNIKLWVKENGVWKLKFTETFEGTVSWPTVPNGFPYFIPVEALKKANLHYDDYASIFAYYQTKNKLIS